MDGRAARTECGSAVAGATVFRVSVRRGILEAMSMPDPPPPPAWVVRPFDEVCECYRVLGRRRDLGVDHRDDGVARVLAWLTIGEVSPITERGAGDTSWNIARSESWVALCIAAGQDSPTADDWRRLGADPRPAVTDNREYAYGAWRALAWLLGVRDDWPTYTGWHRSADLAPERPHVHASRAEHGSAAWQAADTAARDQARSDALRHWRHVRELADAATSR